MGVGADDGQVDEISEPGDVYDARIPVAEAEELVRRAVDAYPDPEDVMGSAAEVSGGISVGVQNQNQG